MEKKALFFGAIGTLVETSELQRRAFNAAFAASGIDWYWDRRTYRKLLASSGGKARIADFARDLGETVDAAAVHAYKVKYYAMLTKRDGLTLRPGVKETLDAAKDMGWFTGFVTATSAAQSQAIFDALDGALSSDDFDYVGADTHVSNGKPAPDIYQHALHTLGLAPAEAIAIEDSPTSAAAAIAAGLETYATPGEMHQDREFPKGVMVIRELDGRLLQQTRIAAE